jgi:hypothetical protein
VPVAPLPDTMLWGRIAVQCPGIGTKAPINRRTLLGMPLPNYTKAGVEKAFRGLGFYPMVGASDALRLRQLRGLLSPLAHPSSHPTRL